jgi:serine/threonine-protein kinase RsbW
LLWPWQASKLGPQDAGEEVPDSHWTIQIASDPANISEVEAFVNQIVREGDLSEETEANMGIALTEIVNNAILHGNQSNPAMQVFISVKRENEFLLMTVQDQGHQAETINPADPTLPENLMKTNGRGIFIVEHFMDDVKIDRNDTGTLVTMKLRINE